MVEFLLAHVFMLSATDARIKVLLDKKRIELTTSALLDHSSDERLTKTTTKPVCGTLKGFLTVFC